MNPTAPSRAVGDGALQILGEDGERILCRRWGESDDGRATTLAVISAFEHPSTAFLDRITHELSLKADLDAAWAVRPLDIVRRRGVASLRLEDPGGEPLRFLLGAPMETGLFLRLAVGMAAALAGLHGRGLVHKDLTPTNFLVDGPDGRVRLTGFGVASRLPRERQSPAPPELIVGTFAYMAPEQTGRMNRTIDTRSDLYALGVVFYEMLTGALPFTAADPMEWIHCHVARQPAPPGEVVRSIPAVVTAIVVKLLAKAAEDRYQTAAGLQADLEHCLTAWEAEGTIAPFSLGGRDASGQLLFRERLYGREAEVARLTAAFRRVAAEGATELALVSGYSGIGKSSVVSELHRSLASSRGLFAGGKFDQYKRGIPYATLAEALQSLVRQLLGKSDAELAVWREALTEALGQNGRLMVNLIPDLVHIVGEQPAVADLAAPDAQSRFQMVFRRFLGVFARPEHPLVLFLDDLQWVDAATLDLLAELLVRPDVNHLFVVGAYRDNEVGPDHPLPGLAATVRAGRPVHDIRLAALSLGHVEELVADALRATLRPVRPLAELIFERTGGNPFFAIHFVTELVDEGLLAFDRDAAAWSWDLSGIVAKGFTDNVADLMAAKLGRLPDPTRAALRKMACLGNATPAATLALVRGTTAAEVHEALWPAIRADLVLFHDGDYRFLHDRIHEAAYADLPEAERAPAHLAIGRLLVAHTPPDERDGRIFEIVDQFVRGATLITAAEERREVAALNLAAGRRAKAGTAYLSALRYLSTGRALLPDEPWDGRDRLVFELELNLAECEFLTGDFAAAEERFAALLARAVDQVDLAAATRLLLDLFVTMGDMDRALEVGLDYLRRADPEWPAEVTLDSARREYRALSARLAEMPLERLLDLPPLDDPAQRATMDVLTALSSPTLFGGEALRQLVICRMAALCLDHGNSDGAPLAYVLLGSIQGMFFGDYRGGFELARIGLDLVERPGFGRFRARVYSVFATHVSNWTQPLGVARTYLRKAFDAAQESGDVSFAAFACIDLVTNLLASGTPLAEVEREAVRNRAIAKGLRFGIIRRGIAEQLATIRMLRGAVPVADAYGDAVLAADEHEDIDAGVRILGRTSVADPRHRSAHAIAAIREAQARVIMGDAAGGIGALDRHPPLWTVPTQLERAEFQFYDALGRAALCDGADDETRRTHLDAVRGHHRQLAAWAESCPETFETRAALVGAEIARLEGHVLDAERLYELAIRSAREAGFVQNEALAYELAAHFYAGRGFEQFAHLYLRNARRCYLAWGADGKVRQIDLRHPHLDQDGRAQGASTVGASVDNLDLATVIKVSQAVSGEIIPDRLRDTVMRTAIEQAGAERGLLIVSRPHGFVVAVEGTTSGSEVIVELRQDAVTETALPASVLRYVLHTHDCVVVDDALADATLADDACVRERRVRSLLCLPLLNRGKLIGVLYLENNLSPRVFSAARIPALKLLASQAAVSLQNTQLYQELAAREAKIRRLVDANIIGIFFWDEEGRILEANDAFLQIVGHDRSDLATGRILWEMLLPPDGDGHERRSRPPPTECLLPFETDCVHKDGRRVPVLIGTATFDDGGRQGVAFVLDLTERRRIEAEARDNERRYQQAQAQLAHANRVASLGQLTASIAHEVSQPIAAALINAQVALRWLDRTPPDLGEVRQALDSIVEDGARAGEVVDRIRALFKKSPPVRESLDVNEAILSIVALTRSEAEKAGVTVRTRLAEPLPMVHGDRVQLRQVILNLVLNALEAMAEMADGERDLEIGSRLEAENVVVAVRDTGPGLAEDELQLVFEAFHTTKPTGLGVGLSICRSIMEAHGGRLWASRNEPRGATFQFTLPLRPPR